MAANSFHIVDVFAEHKYAGNQLAVFTSAQGLSGDDMQKIAKEIGFSETTFLLSDTPRDGGYDVRIFTPGEEVPFAGHPTLGTAYVIRREVLRAPVEQVKLNLKVGQIPVTFGQAGEPDVLWMRQNPPAFGPTVAPGEMADLLGLAPSQIDARFPVQEVSTGLWFVIVPLVDLNALKQARLARDSYFAFIANRQAKAVLVVCPEPYDEGNDLSVRVFVPYYGIEEDPATGSGNGCLAAWLVRHRFFGRSDVNVRVQQGHEIGRPSLIRLRAGQEDRIISVRVGGKVASVAKGEFL
jgi:trans-2,3-dihydro-3-hydroxyanthranilate isomerase